MSENTIISESKYIATSVDSILRHSSANKNRWYEKGVLCFLKEYLLFRLIFDKSMKFIILFECFNIDNFKISKGKRCSMHPPIPMYIINNPY